MTCIKRNKRKSSAMANKMTLDLRENKSLNVHESDAKDAAKEE